MEFVDFILEIMKDERPRRQTEAGEDTLVIIEPTPRIINDVLELAFFVLDDQGMIVNGYRCYYAE